MGDLFQHSIEIILENQSASGAYPACPTFPTYRYSWFRDGSFIAYAMDLAGEHESATRFHDWAARIVNRYADVVGRAVAKAGHGEALDEADVLHTRYTVAGEPASEAWPNFQLDGFGTWLWALGEHVRLSERDLPAAWCRASGLAADYLGALWRRPCYDCWEEFPGQVHTYTLAAIYAGLRAQALVGNGVPGSSVGISNAIKEFIFEQCVKDGHFVKYVGSSQVDGSLLGLAVPYGVVPPEHPIMRATVTRIEEKLRHGGGVHRYATDSFYGGGEWVLLTAWLGWYYAQLDETEEALAARNWVEAQVGKEGQLPEQMALTLNRPECYEPWRKRWGEIASPLLWSHAKYITLLRATS
jgi:GH15 family glucan-1,4-alpha-glucosidase